MVQNVKDYFTQNYEDLPEWLNFLDKDYTEKILVATGFEIEDSACFRREIGLNNFYKDYPNFLYIIAKTPV